MPILEIINNLRKSKGLPELTEYEFGLSEINKCRKAVGLPKIKPKTRTCIVCYRYFKSFSASHRVCDECRREWKTIEPEDPEYSLFLPPQE